MTAFRDEHTALVERVARLQDELREAREAHPEHGRLIEELRELTARLERAKTRGDADRTELDALSAAVARIRATVGDPVSAAGAPEQTTPAQAAPSGGRGVFVGLAAAVAIVSVLVLVSQRETSPKPEKPGDPTSVAEARMRASKAGLPASGQLLTMKAFYVSSDGTLHSDPSYSPYVEYTFGPPPEPAPSASSAPRPIGAPADPAKMFRNEWAVTLSLTDAHVVQQMFMIRLGGPVPDPHCRLADVWKAAQGAGAPAEAVAIIEYGEGFVPSKVPRGDVSRVPRWHFVITSTPPFELDVSDRDCTAIR